MALWMMILRKMAKNRWLELSLLLGLVVTVALVNSMPVYTEAILTRMLVKDLEQLQTNINKYPGIHYTEIYPYDSSEQDRRNLEEFDRYLRETAAPAFGIPVRQFVVEKETGYFNLTPESASKADPSVKRGGFIQSVTGLYEHIRLVDGRLPSKVPVDGVYEALVTERTLRLTNMVLDTVFEIQHKNAKKPMKIKAVGVFEKQREDDLFFRDGTLNNFSQAFLVDEGLFDKEFSEAVNLPLGIHRWFLVLDYTKLQLRNMEPFLETNRSIQAKAQSISSGFSMGGEVPSVKVLESYPARAGSLRTLMWSLNVPVLIMLSIYMFMVSNLIAERQKNEIAVLRSRGASRTQIMLMSMAEGLLLCGAAMAIGPFAGLWLTKVLGASNGFMEFVNRTGLQVQLNGETFRYAGITAFCSFVMMQIPVLLASRISIVGHKQSMARMNRTPLWHKLGLDVIALGIAIYGLRVFHNRMETLKSLGLDKELLRIDPLQFLIPSLFILGFGLLLLRLYPYMLRLVYWIGRKWWPPSLYGTLIQLGRSSSQYQFLMVFLIMTVATGIYSASAARTINNYSEDRVRYANGADLVLDVPWNNDAPSNSVSSAPEQAGESPLPKPKRIHYEEPPFEPYQSLPGVQQAAKVFIKKNATFSSGKEQGVITLAGIKTDEFGAAAWFRDGLLDHSFNEYLNLMAENPRAVLISRSLAEQKQVKVGDPIWIGWAEVDNRPFVVYGIIDYFPAFNPRPVSFDSTSKENRPMLVVGNLRQIQTQLALEPYSIWYKLKPGASVRDVYQAIIDRKLPVSRIVNTADDLIQVKNDPFLLAINGVMTLGFLISLTVSFVGFLLYWILTLSGRALQTGILRAIGMRFSQLIGMLGMEQLLTSGAAVLIGIAAGNVTSRLFVPLFEAAFDPAKLVPPFRVLLDPMDSIRLYSSVILMIAIGLCILGWMLSRIKIHQALKLGED